MHFVVAVAEVALVNVFETILVTAFELRGCEEEQSVGVCLRWMNEGQVRHMVEILNRSSQLRRECEGGIRH